MIDRLSPTVRNVLLAALGVALIAFLWSVRSVLNPLIAAYFLAYSVHPLVVTVERWRGVSRTAAVNTIFVSFFAVLLLTLIGLGLQARRLVGNLPELADRAQDSVDAWIIAHPVAVARVLTILDPARKPEGGKADAPATEGEPALAEAPEGGGVPGEPASEPAAAAPVSSWSEAVQRLGAGLFGGEHAAEAGRVGLAAAGGGWELVRRIFGTGFAVASFVILLPLYTWFLLFELGRIHAFVRRYLPRTDRERLSRIGGQIGVVISNFFRGRLLICLLKGIVTTIGLFVADVDYALLIGLGAGFLSLVPFVGPLFAGAVALVVALTEHSILYSAIAIVGVFTLAEVIEGYILIPKILGNSLGLHPVVVLLSVFVGGAAFGMFGLLVAIPTTAALVILARELVLPALAELADEGG